MARQAGGHASVAYEETGAVAPSALRLIVIVSCVTAMGAMIYGMWRPERSIGAVPEIQTPLPSATSPASSDASPALSGSPVPLSETPVASLLPPLDPTPAVSRVGIVAGHWGSDSGAVCPDGLTEAEINFDIAQRVVYVLESLGYEAVLLEEFDPRLAGYRANALISIHADSCEAFPNATPPASGFKVASVEDSWVPEAEERLVACLGQCYAARTGMYFHSNSITYDMRRYHTFYEIDGQTPGAIIETGFMRKDRQMLTERADLVAQGIVDGLICFLDGGP